MTQRARDDHALVARTLADDPRSGVVVARARLLLLGLFGLQGIVFSSWLARLPAVRDALDLTPSALGGVLLVGSVGALLTVTVAGIVVQRWGSRAAVVASTAALALAYVLMGVGPALGSVWLLCVGVFLNGVSIALGNVPLNVESARIERAMSRTVIPQFHAAYSIGAVVGSGLGALAATALVAGWSTLIALPLALTQGIAPLVDAGLAVVATQVLLQGIMSGLVAILAFSVAVKRLGASKAAALSSLTLAAATLLAIPVLGEIPSAAALAGIALTLAGVVLASGVLARSRGR